MTRLYGLLPDSSLAELAVDRSGKIPFFELAEGDDPPWQDVGTAAERFRDILGVRLWVLRPLFVGRTARGRVRVYSLESDEPVPRALPTEAIEPIPELPSLQELLSPLHPRPADARDVPWYRPGFRSESQEWVAEGLGGGAPAPVHRQRHHWNISAVSEVRHGRETFFFKASPPMFPHEARITAALATLWPDRLPPVVASDTARNRMLMKEVGGPRLSIVRDPTAWETSVRAYAQMQTESIPKAEQLNPVGLPTRSVATLRRQSEEMLADTEALGAGDYGLDPLGIAAVRARASTWLDALDQLESLQLPLVLEHGDLHAGQVIVTEDGPVFLDWSDAALTLPFGLMNFLLDMDEENAWGPFLAPDQARRSLESSYLEPWAEAGLRSEMEEANRLMGLASPLWRALAYWEMVKLMENRWEMENVAPYFLGQAL